MVDSISMATKYGIMDTVRILIVEAVSAVLSATCDKERIHYIMEY